MILRQGATGDQLATMVGERRLPVLRDTETARVDQLYGIGSARSYLIFGRDGCLIEIGEVPGVQIKESPRLLLPFLERAAR